MAKNDPAFPMGFHPAGNSADQCGGLTKLEWFAGMALQAVALHNNHLTTAEICFDLAEAMLAEAERRAK